MKKRIGVDWNYYDKFEDINEKYLPVKGEGETKATQIVTAVNKLVYKWYNDGDVFDTTNMHRNCNDNASFANWLYHFCYRENNIGKILYRIKSVYFPSEYEGLLKDLADATLGKPEWLAEKDKEPAEGSVYEENDDPFSVKSFYDFEDNCDDEEDDDDEDELW